MLKVILLPLLLCSLSHQAAVLNTPPDEMQISYKTAVEAIFGIAVRLQSLREEPEQAAKNFLVSPLSASLMVVQLMLGAEGKFRQELYNLLSLPDDKAHQDTAVIGYYYKTNTTNVNFNLPYAGLHLELGNLLRELDRSNFSKYFTLTTSNALFVNSNLNLKDGFVHDLQLYKTYIRQLNFAESPVDCQNIINNWAAEQTNNLIRTILPTPPSVSDAAIFTNAVYFKADWETPFSYELTYDDVFYTNKNTNISVEYMRGFVTNITYGESSKLGCKMIGLPYKDNEVVMYIFLPNANNGTEYDINHFASNLKPQEVMEFINKSKRHDVNVQVPKMKLSNSISILKPLQKYKGFKSEEEQIVNREGSIDTSPKVIIGNDTKLSHRASFDTAPPVTVPSEIVPSDLYLNNASENGRLKISNILQQMTLSVDEKGTEAAAVTASTINYIGGTKNFKIDRPFLFFIRHEVTSAVLFWGSIANPVQEQ